MPKLDHNAFEVLGKMVRPPPPPKKASDEIWRPTLMPAQDKLFESQARYILAWSEKGSGKTVGCLHKVVRHCFENDNALAIILVRVRSMANKGGAWDKLQSLVLPTWKAGLGLDYTDVKFDSQHNEFMWIANQYGGWSMVVLISAPHALQLRERIRGYEPSIVFVDELTSCDSVEYFQAVAAQIGRRPFVDGVQQYLAATNPEGPTHWVYQKWFVDALETNDPDFENIYFPIAENEKNLTPGYLRSLAKIYRGDDTEAARMIKGEWVDRPSGEGLFREIYSVAIHVRPLNEEGQPDMREWLMPNPNFVMGLGIDPGSPNNAFAFFQKLPIDGKDTWMFFDEIVTIRRKIPYTDLVPLVMRRIRWWRDEVKAEMPQVWISDEAAFNQYRASSGSFDVLQFEQIYEAHRAKYKLEPLGKIKPCPKGAGSILSRVKLLQQLMANQEIIISSRCRQIQQMCLRIEGKKIKPGEPPDPEAMMTPGKSDHKHVFDAVSYPIQYAHINPTALIPIKKSGQTLISAAA